MNLLAYLGFEVGFIVLGEEIGGPSANALLHYMVQITEAASQA